MTKTHEGALLPKVFWSHFCVLVTLFTRIIYSILVIGEWPVIFLVKRELAIFKNVNCE